MSTTTLAGMRTLVADKLGLDETDPIIPAALLNRCIQAAAHRTASDRNWPWLLADATVNVVADTAVYALPANHRMTEYLIHETSGTALRSVQVADAFGPLRAEVPSTFYVDIASDELRLYPTPSASSTLTHGYWLTEATLGSDSATALIPEHYLDYLIQQAVLLVCPRIGRMDMLDPTAKAVADWIRRLGDEVRASRPVPRVRHRSDWEGV